MTDVATKYPAEPWALVERDSCWVLKSPNHPHPLARTMCTGLEAKAHEAVGKRLHDCINYCAGVNPAAVPKMLHEIKLMVVALGPDLKSVDKEHGLTIALIRETMKAVIALAEKQ